VADSGSLTGFVGLCGLTIEMLFIDAEKRGCGYGSLLIDFARGKGAVRVDVNEQNTQALGFYLSKGFKVIGRDETDDAGRPYPILHMLLN
ncbi:MAG: GNAT family N-acetyltransferase, partial [Muribaculaceae bacterium]|nr:GNAT family N-acetyltransferase [Muribaculaceae bacterium]